MDAMWTEVISALQTKVSPQTFTQWFRPITFAGFEGRHAVLHATNAFIADWLKEHYRALIETTLEEVTGNAVQVVFRVAPRVAAARAEAAGAEGQTADDGDTDAPRLADLRQYKRRLPGDEPTINGRQTLTNFVVDDGNRLAHAAAEAVSREPGARYNPLFIYGATGNGKTHLLQGIAAAVSRTLGRHRPQGGVTVRLMTTETFVNDYIEASRTNRMHDFRKALRAQTGVLLLDDVQFLAEKKGSQEEFFHTFNALVDAGRQIVLTSDRPPAELNDFDARLTSRFRSAMVCEVKPPKLEARVAILQRTAKAEGAGLPDTVAQYLASRIDSNVRDLISALRRLAGVASLTGAPITTEMVDENLADQLPAKAKDITPETVMRVVCSHFQVKAADVRGKSRVSKVLVPRQAAMWLMRRHTKLSLQDIGGRFGGKDHATVISSLRKIDRLRAEGGEMEQTMRLLESQLTG